MASDIVVSKEQPAAAAAGAARAAARLLFVDNIRVFLTVLVIVFHLVIIYTAAGGWIYREGRQDEISNILGTWFCAVNQSYFMGLFLLISAYFVPGSYDRKGPGRFFVDRLIRLGIPLGAYSWIVRPLWIYYVLGWRQGMPFGTWYSRFYFGAYDFLGGGPLWFIETLLIFSLVYVVVRLLTASRPPRPASEIRFPANGWIALFAVLLGVASFLVRLAFPIDWRYRPLNLQFPYFAQYIALFVVGLAAYRRNWLLSLPDRQGRLWLWIGVALILVFLPIGLFLSENVELVKGGWHWQAMVYAQWEAFICVSLCTGLIYLFRRRWDRQGALAKEMSRAAYGAYLIHEPVITTAAVLTFGVVAYPLLKLGVAVAILVPLCFALAWLLRKVPYFDRVL
jgi:hypothetical protein